MVSSRELIILMKAQSSKLNIFFMTVLLSFSRCRLLFSLCVVSVVVIVDILQSVKFTFKTDVF